MSRDKTMAKDKKEKFEVVKNEKIETANFIQQAIASNMSVDVMEKLFALYEKDKANKAREAWITAVSKFQSECPVINKTKKVMNKDGRTVRYQYAPLGDIVEQIKKPLADNNLSYRWEVENKELMIKAKAVITHILGHSESSSFEVPVDKEGFMTTPQKYASALTFAKRYTLCNALGISTGDDDTDATDVGKEPEPKSDKSKIIFLLRTLGEEPTKWDQKKWVAEIKKLTTLTLTDKNLPEIANRLDVLVQEKQNYDKENSSNSK